MQTTTIKAIKNNLFIIEISVDNPDLKAGVTSLARLLNLPEHHDHYVLLQVRSLVN